MDEHKPDEGFESNVPKDGSGYFWIEIRPDNVIFVEPTGFITGEVVRRELEKLRLIIDQMKREGHPVLILINIGKITKHTSESRSAIKQASDLPFDRGAAYGGSRALGMVMQYLQRSIDPRRAHYFRTEEAALAYLQNKTIGKNPGYRATSWRFITVSSVLLLFFAVATYLSWNSSYQQVQRESKVIFSQKAQQDHSELQKRMDVYVQALYGIRGLFNASKSVERNEFDAYFKSLNLTSEFPGFNAISFIRHIPRADLASFTQTVRHDTSLNGKGYPKFAVYPTSKKGSYDVVTYVEPVRDGTNFGFDLSSDPVRSQTLVSARDSGLPAASASITFSSTPVAKGFIVTIPIYNKPLPTTVAGRRAQLVGYVNAVFQYNTLFKDAFNDLDESKIGVNIYDDQGNVIYDVGKDTSPGQTIKNMLVVAGRKLIVSLNAPTTYGLSTLTQRAPNTTLSSGIFTLILLGLLLGTLLRSRGQAVKLANTTTTDLEHERNLAVENERKLVASEKALAEEKASVERKVVERTHELNEARAQLEASLRGLPFGFAIIDHEHRDVFSNQALGEIIGGNIPIAHTSQAALEHLSSVLTGSVDVATCLREAEESQKVIDKACMLGSKYLHILFVPIVDKQDAAGAAVGSVIVLEDVTEEKALERSRDEFFSIASHELRTPLTAIRGNASMMLESYQDQLSDPTIKQMVTDIASSSERLIDIVGDFLSVSELEQGKVVVSETSVDIGTLASGVAQEFQSTADAQQLYIKVEHPTADLTATIDGKRIKQILSNLLRNALRFTKTGGVTINVNSDQEVIKIAVTDTGSGIPVELQHLLFRKFQQANSNILTRESSQSTGLGLYISKLMAELMGCKLYLEKTEVGKGSTFMLELPLAKRMAN